MAKDDRFGVFSGEPQAVWLTEPTADRRMQLLEAFTFTDAAGRVWDAPKGHRVDGASIPRALWTAVGSPYTGDYRRASILHDVHCDRHPQDGPERQAGDAMFYAACRAGGCDRLAAKLLFLGVRLGSRWAGKGLRGPEAESRIRLRPSVDDEALQDEFARLGQEVAAEDAATAPGLGLVGQAERPSQAIAQVDAVLAAHGHAPPLD
jgi:hypothetical protein